MNKELVIAGILLSVSTVLKICSVVALVSVDLNTHDEEHDHSEMVYELKKQVQASRKSMR